MANSYNDYYVNQAGSGLTAYHGLQYQRGHGFFGNLFANIIKPLGKYFGKQALGTGVRLGSDLLSGQNFKDSFKKNMKVTGENMLDDGYARAKKFAQTGKGRKRRGRRHRKPIINKVLMKPKKSIKKKRKRRAKSVRKRHSKRKGKKVKRSKSKQRKTRRKKIKVTNFDLF